MQSNFAPKNNKKRAIISEINITPFVDVLLVLLIIFMISAPMLTSGVDVDLPKGSSAAISDKSEPITISVKSDGEIFLQNDAVKLSFLPQELLKLTNNSLDKKIYVKADQNLDYGRVMEVVKKVNLSGFTQVILVTELAQ